MPSPFIELEVGERTVKLTNPDKVLFPKARKTKRDLAEYYLAVADAATSSLTGLRSTPMPEISTSTTSPSFIHSGGVR